MVIIHIMSDSLSNELVKYLAQSGITASPTADGFDVEMTESAVCKTAEYFCDCCLPRIICSRLRNEKGNPLIRRAAEISAHRAVAETQNVLREYVTQHNSLNALGFLRFRLRDVINRLCALTNLRASEMAQELQYRDFLAMLREYVRSSGSIIDTVLLLADSRGHHHIYTSTGKEITYDYADIDLDSPCEEDVILSSLITIAPRVIYLCAATQSSSRLVDTISKIFRVRDVSYSGV